MKFYMCVLKDTKELDRKNKQRKEKERMSDDKNNRRI